jgi:hypothetical protein
MAWETYAEREKNVQEARARLDEAIQPFDRAAPRPFTDENAELYRKRTLPIVQQYAPNYQDVKIDDARGSAFDLLEKQFTTMRARKLAGQPPFLTESLDGSHATMLLDVLIMIFLEVLERGGITSQRQKRD